MVTFIQTSIDDDGAHHDNLCKIVDTSRAVVEARKSGENANNPKIDFYVSEFLKWVANTELPYRQLNNSKQLSRETSPINRLPDT